MNKVCKLRSKDTASEKFWELTKILLKWDTKCTGLQPLSKPTACQVPEGVLMMIDPTPVW